MEKQQIEVVKQEAGRIMSWAQELIVRDAEGYKLAYEGVKKIKGVREKWTDYWDPLRQNAHATWKGVCQKEKEGTDICDKAERLAKMKAEAWKQEDEMAKAKERQRLQALADERARKERERLTKQAEKLKTPELKQERLEEAAAVEAPIVEIGQEEKPEGVVIRKTWKARLVDKDKLIAAATPGSPAASLLAYDEKAANALARGTKGKVVIPGIDFYEERSSSVRGGNDG